MLLSQTVALNYQNIKNNPERLTKIKPCIDQYNWKERNFPSPRKNWKTFESNDKSIALNFLYMSHITEQIRHAYKSKHNLTRKNQIILLMITYGKKWHYLATKKFFCIA